MDLAREFGQVCWRTLLASISGQAVVEWREYFSKHGFKHQMDNWRFAVTCLIKLECHGDGRRL